MITGRLNYLNKNIHYYVGQVFEYDIKHAYPSILRNTDFIFNDTKLREDINNFKEYENKKSLLIRIGKELGSNKNIGKYINSKLIETIERFQSENDLDEDNIISIKKDAIFVIKKCNKLIFDDIEFDVKNKYNMYFYDYISKHEYYILKKIDNYFYSIKGKGATDIEKDSYDAIVRCIYMTLSTGELTYVKKIQDLFKSNDINKIKRYMPSFIPFNEMVYLPKEKLFDDNKVEDIDIKDIYLSIFSAPLKSLINYLL